MYVHMRERERARARASKGEREREREREREANQATRECLAPREPLFSRSVSAPLPAASQ
jgi:hypothetical protein